MRYTNKYRVINHSHNFRGHMHPSIENDDTVKFPTWNVLQKIDIDNLNESDINLIVSACIYYLNSIQYTIYSYNSELPYITNHTRFINNMNGHEQIASKSTVYKSIKLIYQLLTHKNWYNEICIKFNFTNNNYDVNILKELFDIESKYLSIEQLLNHYIQQALLFLEKCKQITLEKMKDTFVSENEPNYFNQY